MYIVFQGLPRDARSPGKIGRKNTLGKHQPEDYCCFSLILGSRGRVGGHGEKLKDRHLRTGWKKTLHQKIPYSDTQNNQIPTFQLELITFYCQIVSFEACVVNFFLGGGEMREGICIKSIQTQMLVFCIKASTDIMMPYLSFPKDVFQAKVYANKSSRS